MRALFLAVSLVVAPVVATQPVLAQLSEQTAADEAMSTGELVHALALDEVFAHFGRSIEAAPRQQGIPFNAAVDSAWVDASRQVFVATRMQQDLVRLIDNKLTAEDLTAIGVFYRSELGQSVIAADRAVAGLSPDEHLLAVKWGTEIGEDTSQTRRAQLAEILSLVGGDLSTEIVRESVRGMLIGMFVAGQGQGDIVVPWQEIDLQIDALMPQIAAEIAASQSAITVFAYRDVSDEDLDRLVDFLRGEPARRLYTVVLYAVSEVISERMSTFGKTLAAHMARVNI